MKLRIDKHTVRRGVDASIVWFIAIGSLVTGWSIHYGLCQKFGQNVGFFDVMFSAFDAFESPTAAVSAIAVLGGLTLNFIRIFRKRSGEK